MRITIILLLVSIAFQSCSESCTTKNINIVGKWDAYKVIFQGNDGFTFTQHKASKDDLTSSMKRNVYFNDIIYQFSENGKMSFSTDSNESSITEVDYTFMPGSNYISFMGANHELKVINCNEIVLTQNTKSELFAKMIFHFKRM